MSEKTLVIVESPTKARTITKFLGKEYIVKASNGHIRDLPNNASEVPEELKKQKWAKLGVNIEANFDPLYIIPDKKKDHVRSLREALKGATSVFLATDEDREGESISWHLVEALKLESVKPKLSIKRLVFHEITKDAIQKALLAPRDIDFNLVRAQETRRIVDRLFGYEVSPLLWKKMAPRLSAGRVQSVAVRLLVSRERDRIKFKKATFWALKAVFGKANEAGASNEFEAELTHVNTDRVASGKDFEPTTGLLKDRTGVVALTQQAAERLRDEVRASIPEVLSIEEKPFSNAPMPPFVTSSLQQEANAKLRLSAKATMGIAQQLYENGYITYMRTDSTTLSEQALAAARTLIKREYGDEYLPQKARVYATKVKNAQEAHEAIRPAGESFTSPETVRDHLGMEAFRLYDLIWKRTVASQMENSRGTHITAQISAGSAKFRASGKTISFPGYLRAYVEGSDDPEAELADRERFLPKMAQGEKLRTALVQEQEHTTQPPARYTEGSLIKELERLGIGRPSTWATIVELVLSRSYAFKKGTALVPTFTAMAVVGLLEKHFSNLLDYEFTARLEDDLDAISRGESHNINYLKEFYFGNGHPGLKPLVELGQTTIDPREVCGLPLGFAEDGTQIEVRIGRFGPFITNGTLRTSVPEQTAPDELDVAHALELLHTSKESEPLGAHPETQEPIFLKNGPYGPYVQLGESVDGQPRPKMASLLSNISPSEVTLETAVKLLSLPRTLGVHPESKEPIVAANGRFGPYIKCGVDTRTIPMDRLSPIDITLEQALELLAQQKTRGRGAASKPQPLRELGAHPGSGLTLTVLNGRYGPYVSDGTLNASLPKDITPEALTMDQAVTLLQARADKAPVKRGRGGRSAAKKPAAKKPAAEKKVKEPKPKKEKAAKATDTKSVKKRPAKKVEPGKKADDAVA